MDTRSKILTPEAARALQVPLLAVATGYFDVLRVDHARELTTLRRRTGAAAVLAVVLPWEGALLSLRARCEMAAALRMVDYVVSIDEPDLSGLAGALQPLEILRLEAAEARRARELAGHVRRRQS
jgi:bifunctional ADP-heptose synthase (sugar kinase/adenylyltransferase)